MSSKEPKVNVEVSRMLFDFEYDALIARKAERRKQLEEERKKEEEKKGEG